MSTSHPSDSHSPEAPTTSVPCEGLAASEPKPKPFVPINEEVMLAYARELERKLQEERYRESEPEANACHPETGSDEMRIELGSTATSGATTYIQDPTSTSLMVKGERVNEGDASGTSGTEDTSGASSNIVGETA